MARRVDVIDVLHGLVLVVIGALLGVIGAFATPRSLGPVSVGALIAVVGNVAAGLWAHSATGRPAATVLPGLGWLAVALAAGSTQAGGSLIVLGDTAGYSYLLGGAAAIAVTVALAPARRHWAKRSSAAASALGRAPQNEIAP